MAVCEGLCHRCNQAPECDLSGIKDAKPPKDIVSGDPFIASTEKALLAGAYGFTLGGAILYKAGLWERFPQEGYPVIAGLAATTLVTTALQNQGRKEVGAEMAPQEQKLDSYTFQFINQLVTHRERLEKRKADHGLVDAIRRTYHSNDLITAGFVEGAGILMAGVRLGSDIIGNWRIRQRYNSSLDEIRRTLEEMETDHPGAYQQYKEVMTRWYPKEEDSAGAALADQQPS